MTTIRSMTQSERDGKRDGKGYGTHNAPDATFHTPAQKGRFAKCSRPISPWYLERHPADHTRRMYSKVNCIIIIRSSQMRMSSTAGKSPAELVPFRWSFCVNIVSTRHENTKIKLKHKEVNFQ